MENMIHLASYGICMGAVQALFFALLLLSLRQGQSRSNRILAALLIIISLGLFAALDLLMVRPVSALVQFPLTMATGFFIPPLLFFYIQIVRNPAFRFSGKQMIHFLPALLLAFFTLVFSIRLDSTRPIFCGAMNRLAAVRGLWILYAAPYLLWMARVKSPVWHATKNVDIDSCRLYHHRRDAWLRLLVMAGVIYWMGQIVSLLFAPHPGINTLIALGSAALIYVLGFIALQKPELFFTIDMAEYESEKTPESKCRPTLEGDENNPQHLK